MSACWLFPRPVANPSWLTSGLRPTVWGPLFYILVTAKQTDVFKNILNIIGGKEYIPNSIVKIHSVSRNIFSSSPQIILSQRKWNVFTVANMRSGKNAFSL